MENSVANLKKLRLFGIIWMVIFFGLPTVIWAVTVLLFFASGVWPDVSTKYVIALHIVFAVGLIGYYNYISADTKLLGKE